MLFESNFLSGNRLFDLRCTTDTWPLENFARNALLLEASGFMPLERSTFALVTDGRLLPVL